MWTGLGVGLLFYFGLGIVPGVGTIVVAFTNYSAFPGVSTNFTGFQQFTAAFTTEGPLFYQSLKDTALFVLENTILTTVGAVLLAHRLAGARRGDGFLRAVVFMPTVLGATVISLMWLFIFDPSVGPIAAVGKHIGFQSGFFGSPTLALPLVVFVQTWAGIGFGTLIYIGGLRAIPREMFEAGTVDGCGWWRRYWLVTWPLLAPSTTVVVLLTVVGSFTTYNLIYVLTDGQFGTNTLGILAFNSAFSGSANLGYGSALTVILFVLTLIVAIPLQYWLRARERRAVD